jgi:ABC-type transporter Mla subunit MlaD
MVMAQSDVAVRTIHVIKEQLQEQRRKSAQRRPVLSPQESMARQAVLDIEQLFRTTDNLVGTIHLLLAQFDPFTDEYSRAQQVINEAQLTMQRVKHNVNILPAKLRSDETDIS